MEAINHSVSEKKKTIKISEHLMMGVLAAIVLGICAPLRIYVPFSPVPYVMQNSLVIFFAALLGRRAAAVMAITLLAQGLMGMPVFASGALGPAALFGPTGGYLVGYVIGAFITGFLYERRTTKTPLRLFIDLGVGTAIVLFFGCAYLTFLLGSFTKAFMVGVVPFAITDLTKNAVLTTTLFAMMSRKDIRS